MELTAKITSKGQLTVPVSVRRRLGIKAGERVAFVFRRAGEVTVRRAATSGGSSQGILAGKTNGRVATDEDIRLAVAEGAARGHQR